MEILVRSFTYRRFRNLLQDGALKNAESWMDEETNSWKRCLFVFSKSRLLVPNIEYNLQYVRLVSMAHLHDMYEMRERYDLHDMNAYMH